MEKIVITVSAQSKTFQKKILGVSVLSRIINELAICGRKEIIIISEIDINIIQKTTEGELLPSTKVEYIKSDNLTKTAIILAEKSVSELIIIPSDIIFTRTFLKEVLNDNSGNGKVIQYQSLKYSSGTILRYGRALIQSIVSNSFKSNPDMIQTKINGNGYCLRIENESHAKEAKNFLLQSLRKPVDVDGVVGYYIMRPVTLKITSLLANTKILPNHVTIISMLLGLFGAFLVAFFDGIIAITGAGLYFAGAFIDCVDGEMARIKYKMSYRGAWLDTISDDATTFLFTGAMGLFLVRNGMGNFFIIIAIISMIAFAVVQSYIYHQLHNVLHSGDLLDFKFAWERENSHSSKNFTFYSLIKYIIKRDLFIAAFFILFLLNISFVGLIFIFLSCSIYFIAFLYHLSLINSTATQGKPQEILVKK